METKKNKYGSIPETYNNGDGKPENALDVEEPFPIENTQYVRSTDSAEDRRKKLISGFVPVLLFILLMGGVAFALHNDFNHLYPTRNGDTTKHAGSWTNDNSNSIPTVPAKDFSHGNCAIHNKCAALGLTGLCCPTKKGLELECCN